MGVITTDEILRPPSPKVGEVEPDSPDPYIEVVPQKHRCLLTKMKVCPSITLPGYTWVDMEVVSFFSRYNDQSDITNILSWLPISTTS